MFIFFFLMEVLGKDFRKKRKKIKHTTLCHRLAFQKFQTYLILLTLPDLCLLGKTISLESISPFLSKKEQKISFNLVLMQYSPHPEPTLKAHVKNMKSNFYLALVMNNSEIRNKARHVSAASVNMISTLQHFPCLARDGLAA